MWKIIFFISIYGGYSFINNSVHSLKVEPSIEKKNREEIRDGHNDFIDMQVLVDVWNPKGFLTIWQRRKDLKIFNNISSSCEENIGHYLQGISSGSLWALKMNDASGRYVPGLFIGNRYWIGAVDQCRQLEMEYKKNLLNATIYPEVIPFNVGISSVVFQLQIRGISGLKNFTQKIILGLCLPANCQREDIKSLLSAYNDVKFKNNRKVTVTDVRNLSEGYSPWEDTTFYIILISSSIAVLLVVLATIYDIALRYKILDTLENENKKTRDMVMQIKSLEHEENLMRENNCGSASTISQLWSVQEHNEPLNDLWKSRNAVKLMSEALLSFSLMLNISKLMSFNVGSDTLAPIHGLRVISMLWIILVHTCLLLNEISDNNLFRMKAEDDFLYQTISNGSYAVDTFFFISGCLVTFLYFRTMSKRRLSESKITRGVGGKIMQFFGMMFYRYFRLTPPYLLVIGLIQITMKWHHDHSVIQLPTLDYKTCEKFWWRNALYVNTYFAMDERCVVWSWYLANDSQFYTFGIIILIIGASYISVGAAIGVVVLIASWITTVIITFNTQHVPSIKDPFAHYENLYDKPWTRIGPYLIGMAAGWYLYKTDCKLKLSKTVLGIGWFLSIATLLSIVYGLYGKHFDAVSSAMYTALSHSGWAISVAWVLIVCVTNNGGLVEKLLACKYLYPLSRLTYCAYLVHPALTQTIIMYGESSMHLSQPLIGIIFFGITVTSYAFSAVISLVFEAPMVSFLRIFHPLRMFKPPNNSAIQNKEVENPN